MSYRYLGNKTRLTEWIVGEISRVLPAGSSIADPMCGTASVSMALARAGYSVTAADALTFPVVHARTRLLAKQAPAFKALGGGWSPDAETIPRDQQSASMWKPSRE